MPARARADETRDHGEIEGTAGCYSLVYGSSGDLTLEMMCALRQRSGEVIGDGSSKETVGSQ